MVLRGGDRTCLKRGHPLLFIFLSSRSPWALAKTSTSFSLPFSSDSTKSLFCYQLSPKGWRGAIDNGQCERSLRSLRSHFQQGMFGAAGPGCVLYGTSAQQGLGFLLLIWPMHLSNSAWTNITLSHRSTWHSITTKVSDRTSPFLLLSSCVHFFFPLFFSLVGWMLMRWTLISMLVHFFGPKHSICKYANRNDYKSIIYFCAIKVVSECSGWVDDINFIYSNFYELILNNKCHDMWPWTTQLFIKVFF